jgi:hypothetical protein
MKKRGPKSRRTPALQRALCRLLADAQTIKTAAAACGIGEKTFFRWCEKHPTFATATREARARAKIKLVNIVRNAANKNPVHACWLLERSWPGEYSRVSVERIEQVETKADSGIKILLQTGDKTLRELIDFPNLETDSEEEQARKQAALLPNEPPAKPATIPADHAPSVPIDKRFTGRLSQWQNDHGQS